jgi:hypothetical protein
MQLFDFVAARHEEAEAHLDCIFLAFERRHEHGFDLVGIARRVAFT